MGKSIATLLLALFAACAPHARALTIPTVLVGNPGNGNDPAAPNQFGGVDYTYRIGTTEVTVGQYTEFLNAVAGNDRYGLYNGRMEILETETPTGSHYTVIGSPNHPVNYVSWGDAARFANWLNNGQPGLGGHPVPENAASTERGAYKLDGAIGGFEFVTRTPGALWFLPSENEWYKAAYHMNDGVTANYWHFPTSSNTPPSSAQPPGLGAPSQSNTGNYFKDDGIANGFDDGYAVTGSPTFNSTQNYLTDVGAYSLSKSPYGTFDQWGNVWEWNETDPFHGGGGGGALFRGLRGDAWEPAYDPGIQFTLYGSGADPTDEDRSVGFRVAAIPEPSSEVLAILGLIGLVRWRWRRER